MIVRVRSTSGTSRVDLNDQGSLYNLKQKLAADLQLSISDFIISTDPAGKQVLQDDSSTLVQYNIRHGDMLYLTINRSGASTSQAGGKSESTSQQAPRGSEGDVANADPNAFRCKHGPNATCINCLGTNGEAPEGKKKCMHGPAMICPNCSTAKAGKKLGWLCTHGPGAKCPNCVRTKKNKVVKRPCTHPSHMVCPECVDASASPASSSQPDGSPAPAATPGAKPIGPPVEHKGKCLHGPRGMCENCMPKPDEAIDMATRRCRNHGPHGSCIDCLTLIDSLKPKIKLQDYANVKMVSLDFNAANVFQSYLQSIAFAQRRVGLLYGSVDANNVVSVDVIYEPPQSGTKDRFEFKEDEDLARWNQIAGDLGLKLVGWIFSHPRRDYSISSDEVLKAAEFQAKFGNQFVTLVLFENKDGLYSFEAFQLSDQCTKIYQDGLLVPSTDPSKSKTRSPVIVERAETTSVDNSFFLVTLPIKDHQGPLGCEFPIENRAVPLRMSDLKIHLMRNHKLPYVQRISDLHLLVFLSHSLSLETDMPALCAAVKARNMDSCEGFQLIIDHLAGVL